jgi:hypothetical protein
MKRTILLLLIISVLLLNVIFIFSSHSFLALYYVLWLGGVGTYVWRNRDRLEARLTKWNIGSFKKFLLLGLLMILIEETFAGFSTHLATAHSVSDIYIGILQFWAFNFLTLPGFIIGWYLLLCRFTYSRKEVLVLVGILGLFAEKTYIFIFAVPIMGILLILPTMFTYALIIAPSILSFRGGGRTLPTYLRYMLGVIVPIIVSIPLVLILMYLKLHYPGAFPPAGFVS